MRPQSARFSGSTTVAESSMDRSSFSKAKQSSPQIPPPAYIGFPNGDRGSETFSSMFSDCGFLVNDNATKRRSIRSTRGQRQSRWSFINFQDEDPLELSNFGQRNSQFMRLPDIPASPIFPEHDRNLESPTTLVDEETLKHQDMARLPMVEGTKLWSLVIV